MLAAQDVSDFLLKSCLAFMLSPRVNIDESVPISFHSFGDRDDKKRFMLECWRRGRHLIVLASPDLMPGPMAEWLIERGVPQTVPTVVGSFLTLAEQKVVRARLGSLRGHEFPWLSVTVIVNPAVASLEEEHQQWHRWRRQKSIKKRRSS